MIDVPMRSAAPLDSRTVLSINQIRVQGPRTSRDITAIHNSPGARASAAASSPRQTSPAPAPSAAPRRPSPVRSMPPLTNAVQKGQKVPLSPSGNLSQIKACLGWNAANAACDVDVSAFLLGDSGKVLGDDWFVFYGQTQSPDGSVIFAAETGADRESISIDFAKLNPSVHKIVFVLTIHEALQRRLNFSMLADAYIRILDLPSSRELVSFRMDEYYANVTSMMIGEIYQRSGAWKFNTIGNGVARDLAGLCELYGVQVI